MKKLAMLAAMVLFGTPLVVLAGNDVVANAAQASVTQDDIETLVKSLSPEGRTRLAADPAAMDRLVHSTLEQKAVLAEAKAKGWDTQPQVQAAIEAARREVIVRTYLASVNAPPSDYPSDADLEAAYNEHQNAFAVPRALHLAQIYIAVPPNADQATLDKAGKQAAHLAELARSGAKAGTSGGTKNNDFASLAKANSQDKASADRGGDMGFVPETMLLPAVRDAANALTPGQVSAPVRTQTGFHVLKLIDTRPAGVRPFAEVKEQLRTLLRAQRTQQNVQAYLTKLAGNAPINEDALKKALAAVQ
ncbi:peptidyl-prolyl cis-trans isomerase [Paraburkholderia kururiensis]|uniref:Peptidyl-prolyl cis-trans isomerase n=2 Tax=Paraburkholderia kururiensis TaxID=984307 RepID=A0ABZ0WRC8_9BURK|nr:peptidyl-prolyl cis-trans isomerase [Paraburkholderia kururiensis]WQD79964.1 peptidyl-prolyl cis-trans isomerase [Paraburkholderia kururiensis]